MRAYDAASEAAVQARDLLKDWTGEGFVTDAQYREMEQETVCDLKRTNIFLRLVLGLFTALVVCACVALFFVMLGMRGDAGILLVFGAVSYGAAEYAVSQYRLYRYGIEEALALCAVGLLASGGDLLFHSSTATAAGGAIASVWIWQRFGLVYAPLMAMLFVHWMTSEWAGVLYAVGLLIVWAIRPRYRFTFRDIEYSIAEALLWLGIYIEINVFVSPIVWLDLGRLVYGEHAGLPRVVYWTTWVATWCLPPVILTLGLRKKDKFVIWAGIVTAITTLVTNKLYLGWPRHTWDPMLLGALLIGVALFVRRWLASGPDEVRRGFTARRLSGKDKRWMSVGAVAVGVVSPGITAQSPQPPGPEFGGGASGGGGASSDF